MSKISEALDKIDVEDFLSWLGVDFRHTSGNSGPQLNIRECPRCGGSKYKVFIGTESGLGNCFHGSCVGEPGYNLFTFSSHFLGSKKQAFVEIERYLEETGWHRPKPKAAIQPKDTFFDVATMPQSVALPFKGRLLKYLQRRNFTPETAAYFDWRYCIEGYYTYVDDFGKIQQQTYSRRVIIPVKDLTGEIVTFQGRSIDSDADRKYLFPPKLPGTGRYLYNGHNALGAKRIVIGEGVFDVGALKQVMNSREALQDVIPVGTFGKTLSLSDGQNGNDQLGALMKLKSEGLQEVVMMWDGSALDEACKTALIIKKTGLKVKVANLPEDKDPNEASTEEVIRAFYNAVLATLMNINRLRLQARVAAS